ncbi:uncharacterized protein B0H18DRAFT_1008889 [Fomitopsis serialis]|uniref:uncharacterized protein n=1 Tax=Fomitopsis serialis TaxID=139415 RepID=UPI0020086B01|nr:uncharacterized protein B0H18DRAFT_1008889 [Neoantrodia serialis]KAH9925538.1 hypothetical protein B0H18DRAFT_1008889 [Neoantrodia serialis]
MAPKKAQKMSLNAFLEDSTLGSWADEMDALPTAPARSDEMGGLSRAPDRMRRDDYMSSRSDRGPPREDLPLPTEPPYTAFIGNLAFDITEGELEEFFGPVQGRSPQGFGYIEFAELDGLKDALAKSGSSFAGRTVRVSVAEPPKERSGFGGSGDLSSRDGSRRRFDGPPGPRDREPAPPSVSETTSDWRSAARGPVRGPSPPRFASRSFQPSAAPPEGPGSRFGSSRGRGDMGPPAQSPPDDGEWRRPSAISRNSTSPSGSTPPTPQMGRRKLELLPRTGGPSATASPSHRPTLPTPRAPRVQIPLAPQEHEVEQRLEKEKEAVKERTMHTMSRTSSRQAPDAAASAMTSPVSPSAESHKSLPRNTAEASIRPSFSFASAAAGKKDLPEEVTEENGLGEVTI